MASRISAPNGNSVMEDTRGVNARNRTLARHCLNCAEIFWVRPDSLKRGMGNFCSRKCCANFRNTYKSAEHKDKISHTLKLSGKWSGENNPKWSGGKQTRQCAWCGAAFNVLSKGLKKRYCSRLCSAQDGKTFGENHPNWKGGIGKLEHVHKRSHTKYKEWRKAVFERDGYICAVCSGSTPRINAHHILEYSKYPDRRYDIGNGITLCTLHHQMLHPNIVLSDTRKYFLKTDYRETYNFNIS